ncbi:Tubulin-specific chaperone A [Smittium mucronatum]|uniref:Tubulin-specific chaperone A n=1 Tax=Smittium mucronatum TaxID=133383 RepID=A0A1R0H1E7_9FUNG|nr:Tubulin-specific chaperone A [Smittium mucronatum]
MKKSAYCKASVLHSPQRSENMSSLRALKIKTGSLSRLIKDKTVYLNEAEEVKEKISKLIEAKADEWDIKKQREILEETLGMLPGCDKRIAIARQDLENLVGTSELEQAKSLLENTAL